MLCIRNYYLDRVLGEVIFSWIPQSATTSRRVECEYLQGGTRIFGQRYFIDSITVQAKHNVHTRGVDIVVLRIAYIGDWISFFDNASIRKGYGPTIVTSIRQLRMNLYKRKVSSRRFAKKHPKDAGKDDNRAKLIFA